MSQGSDRRLFVITETGDIGPFPLPELRELLQAKVIRTDHRVRTSYGQDLGTLARVLANPELLRTIKSDRQMVPKRRDSAPSGIPVFPLVLAGLGLAAFLLYLMRPTPLPMSSNEEPPRPDEHVPPAPVVVNPVKEPTHPPAIGEPSALRLPAPVAPPPTAVSLLPGLTFGVPRDQLLAQWKNRCSGDGTIITMSEGNRTFQRMQTTGGAAVVSHGVHVPSGMQSLRFSYQVRINDLRGIRNTWNVPRIQLAWDGDPQFARQRVVSFANKPDWQEGSKIFTVPEGFSSGSLRVGLQGCVGTFDVAKVEVEALP